MQENQISHMFWTFLLLTQEDMASYSRAFQKPKNAKEREKFNQECYPKVNTCSDKMVSENFSGMAEW